MLKRFLKGGDISLLLSAEKLMILVVMALAIILAVTQLAHIRARGRDNQRKSDLYHLQLEVQKYYAVNGQYPRSLSELKLSPQICEDPLIGGDCRRPAYGYTPFAATTEPSIKKASDCNNKTAACKNYVLYSNHMEIAGNPFSLINN